LDRINLLFICSGNIYRSRYAEAYANFLSDKKDLPVVARSRGLSIHLVDICTSPFVTQRMERKGIPRAFTGECRVALGEADLRKADVVVALREDEHKPLLKEQFPDWAEGITYWKVHDTGEWKPEKALDAIERHVEELLNDMPMSGD
jgi:protein-tyrosine phosphatase